MGLVLAGPRGGRLSQTVCCWWLCSPDNCVNPAFNCLADRKSSIVGSISWSSYWNRQDISSKGLPIGAIVRTYQVFYYKIYLITLARGRRVYFWLPASRTVQNCTGIFGWHFHEMSEMVQVSIDDPHQCLDSGMSDSDSPTTIHGGNCNDHKAPLDGDVCIIMTQITDWKWWHHSLAPCWLVAAASVVPVSR